MKQVAVIIPIYKRVIETEERISFRQTFRVLGKYPIVLVCPEDLDVGQYEKLSLKYKVMLVIERFDTRFFEGISGYNRLLLSECFYQRFSDYNFILICQLDAYVFRDELVEWCEKGCDYLGAPIFGGFSDVGFHFNRGWVGNGGFSLRRVGAYLDFFKGKKNVFGNSILADRIALKKKPQTRWLVWILMAMGWRNKPRSVAKHWKYNEDAFWSLVLDGTQYAMKKPSVEEALFFAFERFPSECYALIGKLPFGCHAWKKYQYEVFWKQYIIIE
jgi:hypothetical protein